jgi:excisionase family DNA binding protein
MEASIDIRPASRLLGISPFTLGSLVRRRAIPHYRIGRRIKFLPSELEQWRLAKRVEVKG